jgi:hypothetical protein
MLVGYLAAAAAAFGLSIAYLFEGALGGEGQLVPRLVAAVVVVDQATLAVLALRVPSMAPFRKVAFVLGLLLIPCGGAAMIQGGMQELGPSRWILLAGGMAVVAQGVLGSFVIREAASSQPGGSNPD